LLTLNFDGAPADLFILNAYLAALQTHLDEQEFSSVLSDKIKLRATKLSTTPFVAWDSHTNPLDFTHKHKGVPYDTSNILSSYQYVKGWASVGAHSEAAREGCVKRALAVVQSASKVPSK